MKFKIDNMIKLTDTQIAMLEQSDEDIEAGKLISQEKLDKDDLDFLEALKI